MVSVSRSPTTMSARALDDRRDELGDVVAGVLVVGVGVDDDVGAELQARRPGPPGSRRPGPCCWSGARCGRRRCSRATSIVRSVEPSSMISHSTTSKPGTSRGRSASVAGSVASSLRQGIWMMSFMRGAGAGATGRTAERSTPYTRWRPVSHMASATLTRPAPGPDPAAGRRSRRSVVARARARRRSRWARWSGSSSTRPIPNYDSYYSLLWGRELLHGVTAVLRRLPHADRAPARRRLRRAALARSAIRRDRDHGRRHAGVVRRPRRRAVPPGARRRSRRSSASPPPRCCARASTSRSWPRAPTSTSRTWRFVVWAAALEAERPRRGDASSSCCWPAPGCMRPEAWLLSGLYFLWCCPGPRLVAAARSRYARARPPSAPVDLDARSTASSPATRCSRCTHTSGLAEELGRTSGGLSEVPGATVQFLKNLDKVAGLLRRRSSASSSRCVLDAAARRACRWRCWSSAWARSCSSASPGCRSSTATCSCPSLMVMVFAAVALGGWTMLRAGRAARRVWAVGVGRARRLRRGVHGHAGQLLDLRQRADASAATRTRRCATLLDDPKVRAGAALRPGVDAQPQARSPTRAGCSTRRPSEVIARSDAQRALAHRPRRGALRGRTARRCCAQASPPATSRREDTFNSSRCAGFTRRGVHAVLRRLCPLLSRRPLSRAGAGRRRGRRPPRERRWPWWVGLARRARRRARPARVGRQAGPALRLQRRRERALRPQRDRPLRPRLEPALLRQPAGLHVPAARRLRRLVRRPRGRLERLRDRPDRGLRRRARRPPRRVGTLAVWLLYLAGAQLFGRARRPAGRGAAGGRVPARLLLAPGAQRRADAGADRAVAVGHGRRAARRAPARLPARRASGSGWPARRSTPAGSCCCRCVAAGAIRAGGPGAARNAAARGLVLAGVVALAAFVVANPYARARLRGLPRRPAATRPTPPTTRWASSA